MRPVTSITVVYDATCGICTFAKDWLQKQAALVELQFLSAGSDGVRRTFPQLSSRELAAVADTGEVWIGNSAWIICLWALRDYRDLAVRLTSPGLLHLAREAFMVVSKNRLALSRFLRLRDTRNIEQELRRTLVPKCQNATR
ncbi:MAG TPA: DCC1-like thiol-disulfide oxidoreductase family protein [Candidatus Limnocylindrales bacterium]|nr:DCC1-like thiol-disulfide oxidoreductase family protein [Candidatus Limnocylindrales bacterium]